MTTDRYDEQQEKIWERESREDNQREIEREQRLREITQGPVELSIGHAYALTWSFSIAEGVVDLGVPPPECREIAVQSEPCRRIALFEDGRQIASNEMAQAGTLVCSAAIKADGVKRYRCEIS